MTQAADYKVEFPYGATDGVYYYTPTPSHPKTTKWLANYHRGDDRYTPTSTPVIVNGVQIGLTGATGAVSGPHLHIGRFVNGADTNPNSQGFNLKAPVKVVTVSSDSTNGNYVRLQDADGVQWVYLHLSSQSVKQGQTLQGGQDMSTTTDDDTKLLYNVLLGHEPDAGALGAFRGKDLHETLFKIAAFQDHVNYQNKINAAFGALDSPSGISKDKVIKYLQDNLN